MKPAKFLLSSVAMIALFSSNKAYGQAQESDPEAPVVDESEIEPTSGGLEEILVTARRVEERAQETPVAVSVLSARDLQTHQVESANDLQFFSPSVNIWPGPSSPYSANVGFRGQVQTTSVLALEPPIATYSDGIYLGTAIGFFGTRMLDVQRVEVLKGPQGTLYGRNTTGGAISIYTNMPTDALEGEVSVGAGNLGLLRGHAILNVPLEPEKAALRIATSFSTDDGYVRDLEHDRNLEDQDVQLFRATLKLNPTERWEIILRGELGRFNTGGTSYAPLGLNFPSAAALAISREEGVPLEQVPALYESIQQINGSPFNVRLSTPSHGSLATDFAAATITYDLGAIQIKSLSGYRRVKEEAITDNDGTPWVLFTNAGGPIPSRFGFRLVTQELNIVGEAFGDRLKFAAGAFYSHMRGEQYERVSGAPILNPAGNPNVIDAHQTTESIALYGQATYAVTSTVNVTAGLRWTDESKVLEAMNQQPALCTLPAPAGVGGNPCRGTYPFSDSNISYTAGADWRPGDDIMIYAKTSRGYRSGGVNPRTTTDPISARPFLSEVVYEHEAGIKSEFVQRRLRVNAAYYYQDYRDIQASGIFVLGSNGGPLNIIQNAAKATIQGVEVEAEALPTNRLLLRASLAYTEPKYTQYVNPFDGSDLSHYAFYNVSKWTYTLSAGYTLPTSSGDLHFQADWYRRSSYNLFPSGGRQDIDQRKGFGLLNGQVSLELDKHDMSVSLWAKNLLDKRYLVGITDTNPGLGVVAGFYGRPRTFGMDLTKRF